VTLKQLTLAWRKAKVDLYYSTNPPLFEIVDYEENLLDNLEQLRQRTARGIVSAAELGYKALTSRTSRFVGKTVLAGLIKLDEKMMDSGAKPK